MGPYAEPDATPPPPRGLRHNRNKRRFDLIPPDVLATVADVFTFGIKKYAARNWELGMPYEDAVASFERHYFAWKAGEDRDPESGLPHLAHVITNGMFLLAWWMRGVGSDDRVKTGLPKDPSIGA